MCGHEVEWKMLKTYIRCVLQYMVGEKPKAWGERLPNQKEIGGHLVLSTVDGTV